MNAPNCAASFKYLLIWKTRWPKGATINQQSLDGGGGAAKEQNVSVLEVEIQV